MNGVPRFSDGSPAFMGLTLAAIIGLCIFAAMLSWIGVPAGGIVFLFIVLVFGLVFLRSVRSSCEEDTLTGKSIFTARQNGLTLGVEWLSAFGLFGIAGALFAFGYDALAFILGLAAGFVLSTVLIAPRLGRLQMRSLPDYLSQRYDGDFIRWVTLIVMAVVTLLLVAVQLIACGMIAEQCLGAPAWTGILMGAFGMLLLAVPGGMRSLTSAQVVLAAVTVISVLVVAIWLLFAKTGIVVPQLAWGGLLADIEAAESRLGIEVAFGVPFAMLSAWDMALLMLCLAVGSAVMPSFICRASASIDAMQTRAGLGRGLVIFVIVATVLPALAVLAHADFLSLFIHGRGEIAEPPLWMLGEGTQICGVEALTTEAVREACVAQGYANGFPVDELSYDSEHVLLALPAMAGAPVWTMGLLAMAGLSAALVAGGGALLSFAEAITSRASPLDSEGQGRVALLVSAGVAVVFALISGMNILSLGLLAFSFAGASLFAPLAFGLWWHRTNKAGALSGMIGGFLVTIACLLSASWIGGDEDALSSGLPITAGALGIIASALLTFWVSLATKPPAATDSKTQEEATLLHVTQGTESP